jgi:signal transduction histidine kinase
MQDREEKLQYLLAVIQHVGVGLLVFDSGENVVLTNNASQTLLDVPAPKTLSDLEPAHPELVSRLRELKPGDRVLASVFVEGDVSQIALRARGFRSDGQPLTLVSLQNISAELNEKELDAWQNLIRILTHEVKNSLTPIASLAGSVDKLVFESDSVISPAASEKVAEALKIIRKRSDGLLQFIDAYRDLTHLPAPHYRECAVADLFARVETLISPRLDGGSISFRSSIDPPGLTLTADPHLVEQALINLTLNAVEAVSGRPESKISLDAFIDAKGRPVITVADNGPGILDEVIEKVFVPFFTTKKSGSGIGLSLSRQIMRMHGGSLTVQSDPQEGTVFTMRF